MHTIYIEESIKSHPRVKRILQRLSAVQHIITCNHYGEVFNVKSQHFRLQKQKPALILAKKTGRLVLPTPESFGIGGQQNYYFSHMLNCLYDCRYCFLQGMYPSAHYVLFINYEDFFAEIDQAISLHNNEPIYFFSGYDGDSLAFEPVSHFLEEFLPFFENKPNAILELRTKSANNKALLSQQAFSNCIVAFSLTPDRISQQVEHKVPLLEKRLQAMQQIADHGWQLGLRFDPLIYANNFEDLYAELIEQIFMKITAAQVHSVSIGPLRFPAKMYQRLIRLYPNDNILAHPLYKRENYFSYRQEVDMVMKDFVRQYLQHYLPSTLIFECNPL